MRGLVRFDDQTQRRLFLASAGMLFTELVLIRWIGENVLYVTYFTNFILLASFLGIGLGFLAGEGNRRWIAAMPYTLLALVTLVVLLPIRLDREVADVLFLGSGATEGLPSWILLPLLFAAVTLVMAMIGQEVASLFGRLPPLAAYRLDVLGSIAGIVAFTFMSWWRTPPVVWGIVLAVLLIAAAPKALNGPRRVALAGVTLLFGIQTISPGLLWSPYYKIFFETRNDITAIAASGIPHQAMASIDRLRSIDWIAGWPYELFPAGRQPGSVLVIGAGSGNDVAYALEAGAHRVDAVEIDPLIQELGARLHPDQPYSDPRVEVIIDDGRAFMERTDASYDLIVFALTDSLTLISGQSSLRLESYLFTTESLSRARRLLADDGILALYNLHRDDWVIARMADTLRSAFEGPICMLGPERRPRPGFLVAAGPGLGSECGTGQPALSGDLAPPTDDKPFLYVRSRGLPVVYSVALGIMLITALVAVRRIGGRLSNLAPFTDLFLMGIAFLLLETKGVVQFALWFGTTWVVNAFVFVGVLIAVWAAIEVADRFGSSLPLPSLYILLLTAVALAWALPPNMLLSLPAGPRWVAATVVTFGPVFLANLVFAQRFRETASSTTAFGANLLGAMIGGALEYSSLIVGHRSIVLIAGIAYVAAFVAWRSQRQRVSIS